MAAKTNSRQDASEFPAYYRTLSRRLYKVLEDIGVTTAFRDLHKKHSTTMEILHTMSAEDETSEYICGSSHEGTMTGGMRSDIDHVILLESSPVVTDISEAPQYPHCLLLIQDAYTPAGYAKLQHVYYGVPLSQSLHVDDPMFPVDLKGRLVFLIPSSVRSFPQREQHGPAASGEAVEDSLTFSFDIVFAVRCRTWPACALDWLTKKRDYNWPTREQLDKCRTLGCFLVQVGHPRGVEKHLQWRLSFTLQERMLVTDFNSVQLKCYVLLKMVKKKIIQKLLGEESLSSYHFKTCMFYMIETTPAEFWTMDNLLICVHKCLAKMLAYVENGGCPNYFIPEENMFDGRISRQKQIKLCEVLKSILSADFMYLLQIDCDMLGDRYKESLMSESLTPSIPSIKYYKSMAYIVYGTKGVYLHRDKFIHAYQNKSAEDLFRLKLHYQRTESVTEHTVEQTREAVSLLTPYVEITLMSTSIVEAQRSSKSNEFILDLLTSDRWRSISLESDPFTAKLKQACLLNMYGYYEMSMEILLALEDQAGSKISICNCSSNSDCTRRDIPQVLSAVESLSLKEILQRCVIPCVVFLPAERELVPPALCYEMDRSVGSPPQKKKDWYNWAVVDGKILVYFLLYLNHTRLRKEGNAAADINNIQWLIRKDRALNHSDTALNLLGWINKERELYDEAVECFQESLGLQRTHNAASLHLQDISRLGSRPPQTGGALDN